MHEMLAKVLSFQSHLGGLLRKVYDPPNFRTDPPNPNDKLCGIIDNSGTPLPQLFLAFLNSPEISAVSEEKIRERQTKKKIQRTSLTKIG